MIFAARVLPKSPLLRILKHTGLPRSEENARTPRTPIGMVLLWGPMDAGVVL